MEIYVLDSLLRRTAVIDYFESAIWTERFAAYGDCQIVISSTNESRAALAVGTKLALDKSYRVMVIDTAENSTDDDGKPILTVTGKELTRVLEDRVARNTTTGLTTMPTWILTGTPADIAREIFDKICVTNVNFPEDEIPFITAGTIFPPDTIPEPEDIITIEISPTTVYDAIQSICEMYDLGFRLVRNFDTSELYFDVYSGDDRTTLQSTLPAVVFSPDLDNLSGISELTSQAQYKNVAYVIAPAGISVVYATGASSSTVGFERRVLMVDASDVDETNPVLLEAILQQKGKEALLQNRSLSAFDGELPQSGSYVYQEHYSLGDLVEMRNSDGVTNNMRVTEQIFVSDAQGERSYPTTSIKLLITPGSWYAWDGNQVWDDAEGTWDEA